MTIDIDSTQNNTDWLRTETWDIWTRVDGKYKLVETLEELLSVVPQEQLAHFLTLPAAVPMSVELKQQIDALLSARDAIKSEELTPDEKELQRILLVFFDKLRPEIIARIRAGEPITDEWLAEQFENILQPQLTKTAVSALTETAAGLGIDWEADIINDRAVRWAKDYTYDLVKGLTSTSRETLQTVIGEFFRKPGMTAGELSEMLTPAFGPVRANTISVTETTRAYSASKRIVQQELAEQGIEMERVWNTRADELVCEICGPLNGRKESEWANEHSDGPPAHPRCRCDVGLTVL